LTTIFRRFFRDESQMRRADVIAAGVERRVPSHQNAVDLVPGWNHAFPDIYGVKAGTAVLHEDPRIFWAMEQFGSVAGKRLLELGPLEAAHTSILDRHNPAVLDAVEANTAAYMRCLIAKQVLDLKHAKFYLGNFLPWLERDDLTYDFIVGSGVLYHMNDPIHLLELISRRTDAVYLWTHYFDNDAMPPGDPRGLAFVGHGRVVSCGKHTIRLHGRRYYGADNNLMFCGGPEDLHYWMEKNAIVEVLRSFGLEDVRTTHDAPDHPNGPAISIFAQRIGRRMS
jgi:hypothetical protein